MGLAPFELMDGPSKENAMRIAANKVLGYGLE